ncbi:MAG: AAA family ATPase [Halothece sp.]
MFCHILIGCPSSGKSTLAEAITQYDPNYHIVSTDKIRKKLFGYETIQGKWQQIEAEVFREIEASIQAGYPVIYDATNFKRPWRMALLEKLNQYQEVKWLGWYLKTPLQTCLFWNSQRERQVPDHVIKKMSASLKQFPPIVAEGFETVYPLNPTLKTPMIKQFQDKQRAFDRSLINRQNRIQKVTRHDYSKLRDFERLLYLIHLLLTYPGIGNLQNTDPETVKRVIGKKTQFKTDIEEICAFMSQKIDPIYADYKGVQKDLQWLEENGIIGKADIRRDFKLSLSEQIESATHTYSDIEPFQRLMKTIRLIIHEPFIWDREKGTLDSLVARMQEENLVEYNFRDSLRKDIEKILKPYGVLPKFPMKRGYFAGTAILSTTDLVRVFHLLEAQAKSFNDPVDLQIYNKFQQRMEMAKLSQADHYPVRAIHNRNIVNPEMISDRAIALSTQEVETAIEEGKLLELGRIQGGGKFNESDENLFRVYPLQIVFHNIGWYLGFEYAEGEKKGLLKFERLDRLFLGQPQSKTRLHNYQTKSLKQLITLYQSCGGIFLGNDPKQQKQYLSKDVSERKQVEVTIEIWFTEQTFKFISEGTRRFPLSQMKMSQPFNRELLRKNRNLFSLRKTSDQTFPHRFRVTLPQWSLEDIDLHRWILGFGGEAKVVSPDDFREIIQAKGRAIAHS